MKRIKVTNKLETVPDSRRAADLFGRILRAVREQTAADKQKRDSAEVNQ